MKRLTREECSRDPNAALDSAVSGPVAIVDENGVVRGVLSVPGDIPKRTLEEILAYSRETGTDWALTAEEAGLLRREVERLRARLKAQQPDFYADRVDELEKIGEGLCGGIDLHVNRANVAEAQLTSERERGAKAVRDERSSIIWFLQDNMGQMPRLFIFEAIRRGEHHCK